GRLTIDAQVAAELCLGAVALDTQPGLHPGQYGAWVLVASHVTRPVAAAVVAAAVHGACSILVRCSGCMGFATWLPPRSPPLVPHATGGPWPPPQGTLLDRSARRRTGRPRGRPGACGSEQSTRKYRPSVAT